MLPAPSEMSSSSGGSSPVVGRERAIPASGVHSLTPFERTEGLCELGRDRYVEITSEARASASAVVGAGGGRVASAMSGLMADGREETEM